MVGLLEMLRALTQIVGVSGAENAVAEQLETWIAPLCDEVSRDALGNLIAHKRGRGTRVMLTAHMDTPGFAVTHIDGAGFIRFGVLGDLPVSAVGRGTAVRFENGTPGILGFENGADDNNLTWADAYIDIGVKTRNEALSLVTPGQRVAFFGAFHAAGERAFSPYLSSRLPCAVVLQTLASLGNVDADLYLVFTTQRETGQRGAATAAYAVIPELAIAVDAVPAMDTPTARGVPALRLGAGAAIKIMDGSVVCQPSVVRRAVRLAAARNIIHQLDGSGRHKSDAGAVQAARGGILTGSIGLPVRYVHSACEMADLKDAEAAVALLTALLENPTG